MPFVPKKTRKKVESRYKTIYLRQEIIEALEKIAQKNNTSFNNVVVSMIEQCLEESGDEPEQRFVLFILIIYEHSLIVNILFISASNNLLLYLLC